MSCLLKCVFLALVVSVFFPQSALAHEPTNQIMEHFGKCDHLVGTITIDDSDIDEIGNGSKFEVGKDGEILFISAGNITKVKNESCEYISEIDIYVLTGKLKIDKCKHQFTIQQHGLPDQRSIYFTSHDSGEKCDKHKKNEDLPDSHDHRNGDFHGGTAHGRNG